MVVLVVEKLVVTARNLPGVFWRFISISYSEAPYAGSFSAGLRLRRGLHMIS